MGIAGLGRMGLYHFQRLGLRDDCRVVAVYDRDADVRRSWKDTKAEFADVWSQFVRNPRIEVVLLATPPATHAPLAIEVLAAGKHVIVETPLCLDVADAKEMIAASERAQRMLSVAHLRRWDDDFLAAKAALENGQLGRPVSLKYVVWQYNPAKRTREGGSPDDWRLRHQTGGGTLWELGAHLFDQLLQLVPEKPRDVFARLIPSRAHPECDDGFLCVVTFADSVTAHLEVNRAALAPLDTGWMITGTDGAYAHGTQYSRTDEGEIADVPTPHHATDWDQYYAAVVRRLRHAGPNPVPADEARRVIELIAAAHDYGT